MPEKRVCLISCEHGGNRVPDEYQHLFIDQQPLLASHRGYDRGALSLARALSKGLGATLCAAETTRLLIDLNRSRRSRELFSELTRCLDPLARRQLLADYYQPYRDEVEARIAELTESDNQVVHLSIHTFTPVLNGQQRQTDIGLLYDPAYFAEGRFCHDLRALLKLALPHLRVRYNDPYRGVTDGLTRALRKRFFEDDYLGIELEINQALLLPCGSFPAALQDNLLESLTDLIPAD